MIMRRVGCRHRERGITTARPVISSFTLEGLNSLFLGGLKCPTTSSKIDRCPIANLVQNERRTVTNGWV